MSESWRYATYPPDCDALKKANEAVKKEAQENNDKDLIDEKGEFKRKLSMDPKDPNFNKDGHYRKIWMDAYIQAGGPYSYDESKLAPPGSLSEYCRPKKPSSKLGTLVVTVNNQDGALLEKANVQIIDLLKKYETNDKGVAKFKNLEKKQYSVHAWKDEYTEEVKSSPTVLPDTETHCQITIKRQFPGILPVLVLDQDNKPVQDATVTATPVYKSPGSYKKVEGTTEPSGLCHFDKLRYNTYQLNAYKGGAMSETKNGKVSRQGMNDKVTLIIDLKKKWMSICIYSARWYKASLPGKLPGPGILGIDVYFQIEDLERKKKALYFASYTHWGITWGAPWSSGHTLSAGESRQFQVERNLNLNETSFSGDTRSTIYSIGTQMFFDLEMAYRDLMRKVTVNNIKVGNSTFELPGVDRYSGMVQLVRQN